MVAVKPSASVYQEIMVLGRPSGKLLELLLPPIGLDGSVLMPGGRSCLQGGLAARFNESHPRPLLLPQAFGRGWGAHSREAVELLLEWFPDRRLEP